MYASVHDAALVVGTAMQNLMNSGERLDTITLHFTNSDCPLRITSTQHRGHWDILQQIRKVNTGFILYVCCNFYANWSVVKIMRNLALSFMCVNQQERTQLL